jgi:DNA-binding beta-propeller fold protein YncE
VSPDGKRVFVVNTESRNVSILPADLSSLQAQSFNVEKGPVDIEVAPDNRTVVVVNEQSHSITVADMPQQAVGSKQ